MPPLPLPSLPAYYASTSRLIPLAARDRNAGAAAAIYFFERVMFPTCDASSVILDARLLKPLNRLGTTYRIEIRKCWVVVIYCIITISELCSKLLK